MKMLPCLFFSHGPGPSFYIHGSGMFKAFDTTSEVAKTLKSIGKNRSLYQLPESPDAIVIFSAHWETEGRNNVEILVNSKSELLY